MPVSLKSSGGGSVTMDVPSTASTYTLTLPAATGTVLQTGTAVTVAQGGTGLTTLTANNVVLGNGTGTPNFVAPGSNGNVLTSNGTTWSSTAPSATTSIANGTSNVSISASAGSITMQTAGTSAVTVDTSQNLLFNSGYGSVATAYGCRAWANWDSSGTIRASGGTTSITKNGTGNWTMNFNFTMVDANYSCQATCQRNIAAIGIAAIYGSASYNTLTTTTAQIMTREDSNSAIDPVATCVAIFR
jgi:hypothetical protein